jgi:hypothetical protein
MANTYTQLNVHAVFSVKGRGNFIGKIWKCYHNYVPLALCELSLKTQERQLHGSRLRHSGMSDEDQTEGMMETLRYE